MWKLDLPSNDTIQWYKKAMLPGLVNRIINSGLPQEVKNILLPTTIPLKRDISELEGLLIEPPNEPKNRQDRLMSLIENLPSYKLFPYLLANLRQALVKVFRL